jgi:hypothetical protein
MSKKKNNKYKKRPDQDVLSDHKRIGKRFIPPLLQLGPFADVKWSDLLLPELLWLGILNHAYGKVRGAELGLKLAQAAVKVFTTEPVPWFGSASAYTSLDDAQKTEVLKVLQQTDDLEPLKKALIPFPLFYPECPLNFLFEGSVITTREPARVLEEVKDLISTLFDRTTEPATFMQANAVYIAFVTGKLVVSREVSLANFPAIEKYPHTEESKRVASGVRGVLTMMFGTMIEQKPSSWARYFWNRGLELERCDLEGLWKTYG